MDKQYIKVKFCAIRHASLKNLSFLSSFGLCAVFVKGSKIAVFVSIVTSKRARWPPLFITFLSSSWLVTSVYQVLSTIYVRFFYWGITLKGIVFYLGYIGWVLTKSVTAGKCRRFWFSHPFQFFLPKSNPGQKRSGLLVFFLSQCWLVTAMMHILLPVVDNFTFEMSLRWKEMRFGKAPKTETVFFFRFKAPLLRCNRFYQCFSGPLLYHPMTDRAATLPK